jgi:hypothetical protein
LSIDASFRIHDLALIGAAGEGRAYQQTRFAPVVTSAAKAISGRPQIYAPTNGSIWEKDGGCDRD